MIKDPRQYTNEYPKSNILIKQALNAINDHNEFGNLKQIIANLLQKENDALINVALNLSPSFQVSNIIWKALNSAINEMPEAVTAHIFALPLVLVAGSKAKARLNSSLDVTRLNEFFVHNQIFENDIDSFISGKLIDPLTLAKIKPSQIYYWARNLNNAKLGLPLPIEGTAVEVLNEGVFLRFLLGLTITHDRLGIDQNAYKNSSIALMKLIGEELKNDAVTLFPIPFSPVYLSAAYPVGDSKRKEIAITVAISNVVRKIREHKLVPLAKVGTENDAIKVLVWNSENPDIYETSLWHLTKFEDYQEYLRIITDLLDEMQVEYSYG